MAGQIGVVSLRGLFHEDAQYVFVAATGITAADEGKAVTLDSSQANTVKLAGNQEVILGRLEKVEVRVAEGVTVCTVSLQGGYDFLVDPDATASPDQTPAVGDYIAGAQTAGAVKGYVQKSLNNTATSWLVVETLTSPTRVVAIKV